MRWLVLLIPLCAALFAFRQLPELWYTGNDSSGWILDHDLTTQEGWHHALAQPHFVSYRPLTALSYGLDRLIGGLDPAVFQRTDLLLHAANVLLAYAVASLLLGPGLAMLAALVMAVHPMTVDVVPALARRGDLLVTLFSLAAVWLALKRRPWLAGACVLFAFLAKDVAVVLPAVLGVTVLATQPELTARERRRLALQATAAAVLGIALCVVVRLAVVGGIGGYKDSGLRHGPLAVLEGFATSLVAPGIGAWLPDANAATRRVLAAALSACAALAVAMAARKLRPERRAALWIGGTWLAGLLALWIVARLFAPRLMYPALLPFALVILAPLQDVRRTWPWMPLPLGALALALAAGPLARGIPEWVAASRYQRAIFDALDRQLEVGPQDERVVLVVNYPAGVRFDPARRGPGTAGPPALGEFDQTDAFGESGLWQWMAARKSASPHRLRIYALNNVVFDAPEVTIPVQRLAQDDLLRLAIGPGAFRSYRNGRLFADQGPSAAAANQPLAVSRRELRVGKGQGRLFVFDGRDGQLLELPERIQLTFVP